MKSEASPRGMVIAKLMGGLGNQLFIYAAARRLSVANDVPLKLDVISGYKDDGYDRFYSLQHFRLQAEQATSREVHELNLGERRNLRYHLNKALPFGHKRYIKEERLFEPRLLALHVANRVYLDGYWQNEDYFKDIEPLIRKDLEIVSPLDREHLELAKTMAAANSICLHARRVKYDYLLPAAYYERAIEHMAQEVTNPHFFCFSDDIEWLRDNVRIAWPVTYIAPDKGAKDYEGLWLMTQCKHYIIANSTFSWWGAWLNANPGKIVIAPQDWGYRAAVPKAWLTL